MSILVSDPLALIAIEAGQVGTPLVEGAANGDSKLDSQQRAATIGEPVPIVFCRRNEAAATGGVLISPAATEARFENDTSNAVTAFYHLVLSEGQIGSIQVRDVFQRSCRVGSYTQTYGRRAGTWTPGNYIVARAGYTTPVCPYYCGSVGTYTGMTTLSFQVTIPDGFDLWNRQVHAFIRNGMQVTRLVDGVTGSSSNFADLVNWCYVNSSRLPSSLIDTTALTAAANFMETVGLACDVNITESTNLGDMLAKMAPYFLVTETRNLGKRGLRPLLPVTAGNAIKTTAIPWEFTFTEDHILLDSFEINYTKLADRKPFCVQMIWRQQPTDDVGMIRTSEVRYAGTAETGPYEQHDLSDFCTSENHAVKVGTYILARRRYISHTLRFSVRPEIYNTTLVPGDIVRVTLQRVANITQASTHDYLYEVNRITKTLAGDLTFELTHFPVDSQGRSLVALDVANAVGTGVMLTSNRTGISCDVNSSADTSVPAEQYSNASPLDTQVALGSGIESSPGVATSNGTDGLDKQPSNALPLSVYPAGSGAVEGAAVYNHVVCPDGTEPSVRWFYSDTPEGSYTEFNNFGLQVYVVGSMEISAQTGRTIRAIWYCGNEPVNTYEATIQAGSLAGPGTKYEGPYWKNNSNNIYGYWTSYGKPAYVSNGALYVYVGGSPGLLEYSGVTKIRIDSLKNGDNSIIVDYTQA